MLQRLPLAKEAEDLLDQAGVPARVGTLFLSVAVLFAVGVLGMVFMHRGLAVGALVGLVLGASPVVYLLAKKAARLNKFTAQFPDTLDMIARSLRAGHSFTSAMQLVYQETPEPVSGLFRVAYDEQNLGLPLPEALMNMTGRIKSIDLAFFVTAVNIQRDTGGNLAEILEKLAVTIRERFKILGQLKVYTAQGRLSGYILAVMPVVLAVVLWIINPGYLSLLFKTRVGLYLVGTAVVMQVLGLLVIRKIINIQI